MACPGSHSECVGRKVEKEGSTGKEREGEGRMWIWGSAFIEKGEVPRTSWVDYSQI